jgi:hypothetical protein
MNGGCPLTPGDVVALWVLLGLVLAAFYGKRPSRPAPVRKGAPFVRERVAVDPTLLVRARSPRVQTDVHEQLQRASGRRFR